MSRGRHSFVNYKAYSNAEISKDRFTNTTVIYIHEDDNLKALEDLTINCKHCGEEFGPYCIELDLMAGTITFYYHCEKCDKFVRTEVYNWGDLLDVQDEFI